MYYAVFKHLWLLLQPLPSLEHLGSIPLPILRVNTGLTERLSNQENKYMVDRDRDDRFQMVEAVADLGFF